MPSSCAVARRSPARRPASAARTPRCRTPRSPSRGRSARGTRPRSCGRTSSVSPRKIDTGFDVNVVCGEIPCFSAVASTNGLNDEPGCRSPCTARLNWLAWKLRPPTIASTAPLRGLIATSAACGPVRARQPLVDRRRARASAGAGRSSCGRGSRRRTRASRRSCSIELLLHVLAEVRRLSHHAREVDVLRLRHRRAARSAGSPAAAMIALLQHQPQHGRRAAPRAACGCATGSYRLGSSGMPASSAASGSVSFAALCPKYVRAARSIAVRAVPEVDRVQVRGEDLVLRPLLLELPRERRLLQLARDRALSTPVSCVLDELLRDRRAALHRRLVLDVGPEARAPCRGCRCRGARRSAGPRSRRSPASSTARSGRSARARGSALPRSTARIVWPSPA